MSGFDLAQMLRHRKPGVRIFIVGNEYDVEDEIETLSLGLTKYLCKPLDDSWINCWGQPQLVAAESSGDVSLPFFGGDISGSAADEAIQGDRVADRGRHRDFRHFAVRSAAASPAGRLIVFINPQSNILASLPRGETSMSKTLTATTLCIALLATAGYASAQNLLTAADSGYNNLNSFLSGAGYVYSAAVPDGGSYAGISSTVGSGVNVLGSTATLVAGNNTSGSSTTVSMQWRNRAEVERRPDKSRCPAMSPIWSATWSICRA